MKVRLATRAVGKGVSDPTSMDDVRAGVKMPWVELDGHRFSDLAEARVEMAHNGVLHTFVTFQFIGPVEIVYLGRDGEEIGTVETTGDKLPAVIDGNTIFDVPDSVPSARIEASKDMKEWCRDGSGNVVSPWRGDDVLPS